MVKYFYQLNFIEIFYIVYNTFNIYLLLKNISDLNIGECIAVLLVFTIFEKP